MYFVYIIQSKSTGIFYKGYFKNIENRIIQHNNGESKYTSGKGPWILVYHEKCESKHHALIREKQLKKYNHSYIQILIEKYKSIS